VQGVPNVGLRLREGAASKPTEDGRWEWFEYVRHILALAGNEEKADRKLYLTGETPKWIRNTCESQTPYTVRCLL
jgi:hypothetical protein